MCAPFSLFSKIVQDFHFQNCYVQNSKTWIRLNGSIPKWLNMEGRVTISDVKTIKNFDSKWTGQEHPFFIIGMIHFPSTYRPFCWRSLAFLFNFAAPNSVTHLNIYWQLTSKISNQWKQWEPVNSILQCCWKIYGR